MDPYFRTTQFFSGTSYINNVPILVEQTSVDDFHLPRLSSGAGEEVFPDFVVIIALRSQGC